MANQLTMGKSFAINNLRAAGYSERRIALTLDISRGTVRRHLHLADPNRTTTQPPSGAQASTGSDDSNSTKVPTGPATEQG